MWPHLTPTLFLKAQLQTQPRRGYGFSVRVGWGVHSSVRNTPKRASREASSAPRGAPSSPFPPHSPCPAGPPCCLCPLCPETPIRPGCTLRHRLGPLFWRQDSRPGPQNTQTSESPAPTYNREPVPEPRHRLAAVWPGASFLASLSLLSETAMAAMWLPQHCWEGVVSPWRKHPAQPGSQAGSPNVGSQTVICRSPQSVPLNPAVQKVMGLQPCPVKPGRVGGT